MNAEELDFAYKIRYALNENLDNLPSYTADRLATARKVALSRKKQEHPSALRAAERGYAGPFSRFFAEPLSWAGKMGLAIPLLALVLGLNSLYHAEQQRRIAETAELDAMVLSDELPLTAYLDHGFNAYLAKQTE